MTHLERAIRNGEIRQCPHCQEYVRDSCKKHECMGMLKEEIERLRQKVNLIRVATINGVRQLVLDTCDKILTGKVVYNNQITITTIGGQCPLEADGTFFDKPFYFRSRGGQWTLSVSKPTEDPVDNPSLFSVQKKESVTTIEHAMQCIGKAFDSFCKKYPDEK